MCLRSEWTTVRLSESFPKCTAWFLNLLFSHRFGASHSGTEELRGWGHPQRDRAVTDVSECRQCTSWESDSQAMVSATS